MLADLLNIKLSIVICTYNRFGDLTVCLDSLKNQAFKDFEVIIVNSGIKIELDKLISKFSGLKITHIHYPIFELAACRNKGLLEAKGKYVAFVDDDVELDPNWAKEAVSLFESDARTGGVSGPTIIPASLLNKRDVFTFHKLLLSSNKLLSFIAKAYFQLFMDNQPYAIGKICKSGAWTPGSNFPPSLKLNKPITVDYLEACNMIVRRDIAIKVGPFDESYRQTAEWCEPDLAFKIKKAGYKLLFSPRIKVKHNISQSGIYQARVNTKIRMENFLKFYFRHIYQFNLKQLLKFYLYLLFLNIYYSIKAIQTANLTWLICWQGTIIGLTDKINKNTD